MKKTYLLITALFCIVTISLLTQIDNRALRKSKEFFKHAEKKTNLEKLNTYCLQSIGNKSVSHTKRLNLLRSCVHNNSIHMIDNEFYVTAHIGQSEFVRQMLLYAQGKLDKRPHFECSRRSMVLNDLYKINDYESRMLNVFSFKHDKIWGHVLVEVMNPDIEQFMMHDPTYDVYYKDIETQNPISFEQAVANGEHTFIPCNYENKCSWDMMSPDKRISTKHVTTYWALGYIGYNDKHYDQMLYNSDYITLDKLLNNEKPPKTFCSVYSKYCAKKQDLAQ